MTPAGGWRIWLILAGRGWGKTRAGAEDIASYILWNKNVRVGIVAPTFASARSVCMEGESGLLQVLPRSCVKIWRRDSGELILFNGSRVRLFSADAPERLRGPQHHRVWCDELAAWPSREAFDQMLFGLRLGHDPRVVITTTPRNAPLIRELAAREGQDVYVTRGKTFENKAHLPPATLAHLRARYEGSRLGRQELDGEILEETEGSLWSRDMIEAARVAKAPEMERVVIAIDPAMTGGAGSDETGIVAVGRGEDGLLYVLADWSCRASPDGWARRAASLYDEVEADSVIAEVNAGGEMVEKILRTAAPQMFFKSVRALRGKMQRALPVAALYEQGRVKHVGALAKLEDQMASFAPEVIEKTSPDRVDALVWAVTELTGASRPEPRVRRV